MPKFAAEYREARKGAMAELELAGEIFKINDDVVSEEEYAINPYQDFNGVNLLYFAAYPLIHDICERRFVHAKAQERVKNDWALEASTVARDVFYFANCNMSDFLLFQINTLEFVPNGTLKIASSIRRKTTVSSWPPFHDQGMPWLGLSLFSELVATHG